MSESLEERLRSHAKAFDGLLQLIPAKLYYGEDTSDQWQRKKQTKGEARKAKLAKLDPDNAKSAKDVMEENARKRKREEEEAEKVDLESVEAEQPKEGLKVAAKKQKKQKRDMKEAKDQAVPLIPDTGDTVPAGEALRALTPGEGKAEKRKETRQRKKAKEQANVAKSEAKKARKRQEAALVEDSIALGCTEASDGAEIGGDDLDPIDVSGLIEKGDSRASSTVPSPLPLSPVFDISAGQSAASSISSNTPNSALAEQLDQAVNEARKPKRDPEELKARLQQRIEALRAARKADGLNGAPARNRQELMEARRRKEEQRRIHKKDLRQRAKEEERRKQDQVLARGSPLVSPAAGSNAAMSPTSGTPPPNNFSFGRVAFEDGQQMDAALSTILTTKKRKGPQDPLTAMKAAERKQARINGFDEAKRTDIEEKDLWLNARKRAHGERVRDDTSLLKKTLKRKEQAKKKSEKEWSERIEGVQKGQAMRQKKREENLQKRKEEKGMKGKKRGGKGGMGAKKGKPKPRPGFEGSFKAKNGGGAGGKFKK